MTHKNSQKSTKILKNLDNSQKQNLEHDNIEHQVATIPIQTLYKTEQKEGKQLSIWSKSNTFLGNRVARFSNKTMAILALVFAFSSILGMTFLANSNNQVLKNAEAQRTDGGVFLAEGTVLRDHEGEEFIVKIRRSIANQTGVVGPSGSGSGEATGINITHFLAKKNGGADNKSYYRPKADWNKVYQSMTSADTCQAIGVGQNVSIACFKINGQRISDINQCPDGWSAMLANGPFADFPGIRYACTLDEKDYPQMVKTNPGSNGQLSRAVIDPNGRNFLAVERSGIGMTTTILTESYKTCLRNSGVDPEKTLQANFKNSSMENNSLLVIKTDSLNKLKNEGRFIEISGGGVNAATGNGIPLVKNAEYEIFPNISCQWPAGYTAIPAPLGNELEYINDTVLTNNNPGAVQDSNYKIFEANGAVIKESEFVACKKNSVMSSGATTKFESVVCFFPNAEAKRNQIQNKEKNGATLWCPKGWEFADYDNSIAAQSGQGCYVGAGTPKYTEYAAKIDAGQIRQELPQASGGANAAAQIVDTKSKVNVGKGIDLDQNRKIITFNESQKIENSNLNYKKIELLVTDYSKTNVAEGYKNELNIGDRGFWNIAMSNFNDPRVISCNYGRVYPDSFYNIPRSNVSDQVSLEDEQKFQASGQIGKIMGTTCAVGDTSSSYDIKNNNYDCGQINNQIIKKTGVSCLFKGDIFGVKYLLPDDVQQKIAGFENGNVGPNKENSSSYKAVKGINTPNSTGGQSGQNGNSQAGNNDKVCAQVQTVGQNVNNRQEIKQFPTSCLDNGFEPVTGQMVAAVAFRMSDCASEGQVSIVCKKIDGRPITKALDCPKGWAGSGTATTWNFGNIQVNAAESSNPAANMCILKNSLWGENLAKLIKLENGLLKDAGSTGQSSNTTGKSDSTKKDITPTTDLIEEIAKSNDINTTKCNNLAAIEKRTCQAQALQTTIEARYEECEKNDKSKWCDQDPGDLKLDSVKFTDTLPKNETNNPNCSPEKDMEGKMRPLNEQQCNDRKNWGYKGPFNFQTGGKRGTRNCAYVGVVKKQSYGCDAQGYLKITCDLIGRYNGSNPDQDFGKPDCKDNVIVPTTAIANAAIRSTKDVVPSQVDGVKVVVSTDIPMIPTIGMPVIPTTIFEPTETKNGLEKGKIYQMTETQKTAWQLGSLNVFAEVKPAPLPGAPNNALTNKNDKAKTEADKAIATGGGAGFNIKGLDLLGIECVFSKGTESGLTGKALTKGCLVDRITNFLRDMSIPLAVLVMVWAGYQYFIGGVDGKTNGLKAVQAALTGVLLIYSATFIIDMVQETATNEFVFNKKSNLYLLIIAVKTFLVYFSSIIAILVIMWGGYQFFFSGLDWRKEGGLKAIKNATIGLAIILIANTMVDTLASVGDTIMSSGDPATGIQLAFDQFLKPSLNSITGILFGTASLMAVLVIVWGGYKYFFSGLEISKKDGMDNIRNGVIGLVTVILASQIVAIVKTVVPSTPAPSGSFLNIDANGFYPLFTSLVNGFLVPISTAFAVFFMIMGGFYWTTSNGDENKIKKAKKALINAIIGLVIVILAVSIIQIVRFLVGGLNIGGVPTGGTGGTTTNPTVNPVENFPVK